MPVSRSPHVLRTFGTLTSLPRHDHEGCCNAGASSLVQCHPQPVKCHPASDCRGRISTPCSSAGDRQARTTSASRRQRQRDHTGTRRHRQRNSTGPCRLRNDTRDRRSCRCCCARSSRAMVALTGHVRIVRLYIPLARSLEVLAVGLLGGRDFALVGDVRGVGKAGAGAGGRRSGACWEERGEDRSGRGCWQARWNGTCRD